MNLVYGCKFTQPDQVKLLYLFITPKQANEGDLHLQSSEVQKEDISRFFSEVFHIVLTANLSYPHYYFQFSKASTVINLESSVK